jgi:hypothetical protein
LETDEGIRDKKNRGPLEGIAQGGEIMKIKKIVANNRKKAFELDIDGKHLVFPYANLHLKPDTSNRIAEAKADPELGNEAFTYKLENGDEDSIHVDQVLEYNKDPNYLRDMLLYKLTIEAQKRVKAGNLSTREIIRRLGTSASQFYRLLDQTNYKKSIDQMISLLSILSCNVDLVVSPKKSNKQQRHRGDALRTQKNQLVHA